jgi:hypothetical protein
MDESKLAEELVAAAANGEEPDELARRITSLPLEEALGLVASIGRSRQEAVALALQAIDGASAPKQLRKEARRALHRLRAAGLTLPRTTPLAAGLPVAEQGAQLLEAWTSVADGVGSRVLGLLAAPPLGGMYFAMILLNDIVGIKGCRLDATTKKRLKDDFPRWRQEVGVPLVEIPPDYARELLGEALELNQESGFSVPRGFEAYRRAIVEPTRPFEQAIVYKHISTAEVKLNPELLKESPSLLDEPETRSWFFDFDQVKAFGLEMLQARQSRIVLSEQLQADRQQSIVGRAIREVVDAPMRRGLQRRLEEAAYVLLTTDRPLQARRAVAAAQSLTEEAVSLSPFLRAMMERSLDLAAEVETAKVPLELVRRNPHDPI